MNVNKVATCFGFTGDSKMMSVSRPPGDNELDDFEKELNSYIENEEKNKKEKEVNLKYIYYIAFACLSLFQSFLISVTCLSCIYKGLRN